MFIRLSLHSTNERKALLEKISFLTLIAARLKNCFGREKVGMVGNWKKCFQEFLMKSTFLNQAPFFRSDLIGFQQT